MAVGRISGPLLKANLLRNGIDLAFETDLLYLDVSDSNPANHKIGIKNQNPYYTLDVTGTVNATNLKSTIADVGDINLSSNIITTAIGDLFVQGATTYDRVRIGKAVIPEIYGDVLITGNLHATGSITADGGTITLGDSDTDNVVFNADVNSNFLPNTTDTFDIGSSTKRWNNIYVKTQTVSTLNSTSLTSTNGTITTLGVTGSATIATATISDLSSGRVVTAGASGKLIDSANLTFNGTTLTVTGTSTVVGALSVQGTANVTGATTITTLGATSGTFSSTLDVASDFKVNTNKFVVTAASGNTAIAGTLAVTGTSAFTGNSTFTGTVGVTSDFKVNTNKFVVTAASGNTAVAGTLAVTGATTLTGATALSDNLTVAGNTILGTAIATNTTTLNSKLIGNVVPNVTGTQDIGTLANLWRNVYVSGQSNLGNLRLEGSTITAGSLNAGITLTPNGTGYVTISSDKAIVVPVGNNLARPETSVVGMVRYNSELVQFEGYGAGGWSSLGGVRDVSGTTYIIPELSPGSNERTLYFYADSEQVGQWNKTALTVNSQGFRVPVGNNATRPAGVDGYIRFNNEVNQFEGYQSGSWASLGGVKSVDGLTYILAEASSGLSDDTLYFYANGILQASINTTKTEIKKQLDVTDSTNSISSTSGAIITAGGVGIAKNLYVGANADITGTFTARSTISLSPSNASVTITPSGTGQLTVSSGVLGSIDNMTIGGTTASTGRFTTLTALTSANFTTSGTVTIAPTVAGTIDNVNIGSTTRGAGAFTTLAANGVLTTTDATQSTSASSGAIVTSGGLGVAKNIFAGGNITSVGTLNSGSTFNANAAVNLNANNFNVSIQPTGTGTVTIAPNTVGALDNVIIGAVTPKSATFTELTTSSTVNLNGSNSVISLVPTGSGYVIINPSSVGTIDNMTVGATTARAGTFTDLKSTNLTAGRVAFAGGSGLLVDSANLSFNSISNTFTTTNVSTTSVETESVTSTDLTSGRITFAGSGGLLSDHASLTYNSSSSTLSVTTAAVTNLTASSIKDSSLTQGRIVFAGTDGELVDSTSLYISGGILYAPNLETGNITNVDITASGNADISGTLDVTDATTLNTLVTSGQATLESLVVTNDAEVNGTLNVVQDFTVNTNKFAVTASSGNTTIAGTVGILDATDSLNSTSGAVTIAGGLGIAKNLYVGGNIVTGSATVSSTFTATSAVNLSPANFNVTIEPTGTGTVTIKPDSTGDINNMVIGATTPRSAYFTTISASGVTTFTDTTDSSSSISGGVTFDGGVGIAKNLYVGGNIVTGSATVSSTFTATSAVNLSPANFNVTISPTGTGTVTVDPATTGALDNIIIGANTPRSAYFTTLTTQGNVTLNGNGSIVELVPTGAGYVTINPSSLGTINNMSIGQVDPDSGKFTNLEATVSATLDVSGDVSIQPVGTVTISPATTGALENVNIGELTRGTAKFTTVDVNSTATFTDTTESTSTTSGSVKVSGGVGIVKNLYVGGNTNIAGNLTVLGTTTTVKSTVTTLSDPVITLGGDVDTGLVDPADRGVQIKYARDISAVVTEWVADGSADVIANLSVNTSTLGVKLGDKINVADSGITNLDGIGTVTFVGTNTLTFIAPNLVTTQTTSNTATVGLGKNGFFGYHPTANKFVYIPDAVVSSNVVTGDYGDAEFNSLTLVNALGVSTGGTGVTTLTSKGILFGNGTGALQVTAQSDMGVANATTSYGILTTDSSNTPVWTDVIDCGTY